MTWRRLEWRMRVRRLRRKWGRRPRTPKLVWFVVCERAELSMARLPSRRPPTQWWRTGKWDASSAVVLALCSSNKFTVAPSSLPTRLLIHHQDCWNRSFHRRNYKPDDRCHCAFHVLTCRHQVLSSNQLRRITAGHFLCHRPSVFACQWGSTQ